MHSTFRDIPIKAWDALASLRLTMFLLIALALVSIIGTVIPQGNLDPQYIAAIGGEQGNRYKLYSLLGFFNMYHAWWFLGLLVLLSANLLACSVKRLPQVWRTAFRPEPLLTAGVERNATCCQTLPLASAADHASLAKLLSAKLGRPIISQQDGQTHLFAQRRPWARLAAYLVHFSIILIFVGAIIGSLFGFKGFVNIPEGEAVNSFTDRQGNQRSLGFELRCDQFTVSYYPAQPGQNPMPKEFKSILTLTENGKEIPGYKHARLIVNEPLTYKGITFYQSSYGQADDPTSFYFSVKNRDSGKQEQVALRPGAQTRLADGRSASIVDLTDNPGEGLAATLQVSGSGEPQFFKVYKEQPGLDELRGDRLIFTFTGTDAKMYTGLQVAKDPGVWVVWTGCLLLSLALYVAFFLPHQRVWVRIEGQQVTIAGHTTRGQEPFRRWFDALTSQLANNQTQENSP